MLITFSQNASCQDYKSQLVEGKFQIEGDDDLIIIHRRNKQIEIFNNRKSKIVSDIEWLDNRSYQLVVRKIIGAQDGNCIKEGDIIIVVVIYSKDESYYCQASSSNCGTDFFYLKRRK